MRFSSKVNISRIDATVLVVTVGLVAAIIGTILLGDRVGVVVVDTSPSTTVASTTPIVVRFNQAMNRDAVPLFFQVEPTVTGAFDWNGNTLTFRPTQALQPGTSYTVTLHSGMESDAGRKLLEDVRFMFSVRFPQIAYLSPGDSSAPANMWIASVANPSDTRQMTFSPTGITSFSISPEGNQVAFAERNGLQSEIKLLDLETGALLQLTNCVESRCERPVWSPIGDRIAYERVEFNNDLASLGIGFSRSRIWVINLTSNPATTTTLFRDTQILGMSPVWSSDGNRIALYDMTQPGVRIYDFSQDRHVIIPSTWGAAGSISPDGTLLALPAMQQDASGMNPHLRLINLDTDEVRAITLPTGLASEEVAAWSPNGQFLAFSTRSTNRGTTQGDELYLLDVTTLQLRPLITEANYTIGAVLWDATGTNLLIQRSQVDTQETTSLPEVWLYNLSTSTLSHAVTNAFNAQWIP